LRGWPRLSWSTHGPRGGRIPLHRQTYLDGVLRGACSALAPQGAAAGVEVRVEPGDVTAFADPVRMRQAIGNRVRKALAHTFSGGLVRAWQSARAVPSA
jgi:signal transduction histidine kinase